MNLLRWLAILPGLFLMYKVYQQDKIEHEPFGLVVKIAIAGALTVISALILETAGEALIYNVLGLSGNLATALDCFFVVALAEEGGKYFVMKKCTWRNLAFNYRFDGVVYAVCASMGFAIVENVLYVIDGGVSTAIMRALTSLPGHCIFGIFMGHYYGEAKLCEVAGDRNGMKINQFKALWIPLAIHGFYDYCLCVETPVMVAVFFAFIIVLDIVALKQIKKFSKEDKAIYYQGPWDNEF